MDSIPVVDLSPIFDIHVQEKDWVIVANKFRDALQSHGFVYIQNHGVSQDSLDHAFDVSRKFFNLPQNIKKEYSSDATKHYHGYSARPAKSKDGIDYNVRETFDFAGIQRFYPNEIPEFGRILEDLESESKKLLQVLLKLLAKSLHIEDDSYFLKSSKYLNDSSVPSYSTFRTLYYPPIAETIVVTEETTRTQEHTDYGLITLLFQDMSGGLEIQLRDGKWTGQKPAKNTVLINTGDLLEFWTGGLIPATPHRVLMPKEGTERLKARQSIAYFVHPDDDTVISAIPSNSVQYKEVFESITAFDHAKKLLELVY